MNEPMVLIFLPAIFVGLLAALTCFKRDCNVLQEIKDVKKMSSRLLWRFFLMLAAVYVGLWFDTGLIAGAGPANVHVVAISVALGFNLLIFVSEISFTAILRYCFLRKV